MSVGKDTMRDLVKKPFKDKSYPIKQIDNPGDGAENISIIVKKKKINKRTKYQLYVYDKNQMINHVLSSRFSKDFQSINKHYSMPNICRDTKTAGTPTKSSDTVIKRAREQCNTKYTVNLVSEYHTPVYKNPFNKSPRQPRLKVYRCQLNTQEESCCCSCNSDAMFEVMKSLYDCYKMKNCNNCNCILCGHLPREERQFGAMKKSLVDVGMKVPIDKAKLEKAKAAGLLTPIEGKSPEQKEKIVRGLGMLGLPLPVGKTPSEKKLIDKVRTDLGLPPEPRTPSLREKYNKAINDGAMVPLEGKTPAEKEKILKDLADRGIPLPEGRTASENALIAKVKARPRSKGIPSEKLRRAKAAGLLTPLQGKSPQQKEKILKGLAMEGLPLPEARTPSEKKLIDKVRADLGLPPEPKSPSLREKYNTATNEGVLVPLEGKTPAQKEKILKDLAKRGIPLPEGRTLSEEALIAKVKARPPSKLAPSEKLRRAKAAGLITPLAGKSPEQKEKIVRGLAMGGLPLPEAKTPSERKLIDKIRAELGLPPEPKSPSLREKYNKAADDGLLVPLEGKTPAEKEKILQDLAERGIPLPEGRTPSEKALVDKLKAIPPEKLRKAKAAGLITPLNGKSPEQKENILRGLANEGIPLPEATTPSEIKLIDKVRADLGLPPEPKTPSLREKYYRAANEGVLVPLEGKTPTEKQKILQSLADRGIPLPEGRTPSEKALVAKIKAKKPRIPSEKLRRAKAAGLLTPLEGKTPEQKEKIIKGLAMESLPLPEGRTPSEKKLIDKVRADLGLPPEPKTPSLKEKYNNAANEGLVIPLEGKTPAEKEKILQRLADRGIPLPEGRTPSEKALIAKVKAKRPRIPSEKLRRAKAAGLLTPLEGKTPEEKEKILKGLAMVGIPLPEGKTPSEKKIINKIRADLGLPPEPRTPSLRDKYDKAVKEGVLLPLEGKTPAEKRKILDNLMAMGIPLPEGRTSSEKAMVADVKAKAPPEKEQAPSEKMRRAKAAGLITPLTGKTPQQKEDIVRGLAMLGLPLPVSKTKSEKDLIKKVRNDLGLPPEPKTPSMREKYDRAAADGVLKPLEGKTPKEKQKILQDLMARGIPLPEGRTPSEKAFIAKAKSKPKGIPSEKLRRAKAAGLLTPLEGKTPEQKEKIIKGLAMEGLPLPEGRTPSEKKLIDKVRTDLGLPPEPKTPSLRDKYKNAANEGLMVPLEGKTLAEKENILQALADRGIPLPDGRTPSEKALIAKVRARARPPSEEPSKRRRSRSRAISVGPPALPLKERIKLNEKSAKVMKESKGPADECICSLLTPESERDIPKKKLTGVYTPLEGKTPEQKDKILRGLAKRGLPLPESKSPSERKLIDKVRTEFGLPPEPRTPSIKQKYAKAQAAGFITPLEGKTPAQKENILRGLAKIGVPLPEGRSPSEKAMIAAVKEARPPKGEPLGITTEKIRQAKAAGLLTPLEGKTPDQREKILKGLAKAGFPLPEGRTASEKALIRKVKSEFGIPEEPLSERMRKAQAAGLITPLSGKPPAQKEKILRGMAAAGLPLPEGKTPSEKALIKKVKADSGYVTPTKSEKMRKAKAAGLLSPLKGKTPSTKEKLLKARLATGLPMPEDTTPSEKDIIKKISTGKSLSDRLKQAKAAGLLTPLQGKTPEQKKKILRDLANAGLPLPEAKTASERSITNKIRDELGLPPEPRSLSLKEKYKKAHVAGIITPLEGKTPEQKEQILKKMQDAGIPLPEGRTPSEKAIIKKLKEAKKLTPSQKLKEAKATGLLTPLKGKSPAVKEKILKGLAKLGLPLPDGRTPSEKDLIDKVRNDLGLPPEPTTTSMKEKMRKAHDAGHITPLDGKTRAQKEKILKKFADAGIPLPEGRTPSEKAMIKKYQKPMTPSEKKRKRIISLTGKSPEEKAKIMKDLAMLGLPLPETKTASEKSLAKQIRKVLGLPPEPKSPSEKERYDNAQAAGLIEPLEGKTPAEKGKILRKLANMGLPLPEGRTPSEKSLITKVKAESRTPIPSEKWQKAKAAGILTPIQGKTPAEKEKILKKLAEAGLPLPEGKTPSEKSLIRKIKTELGIPPVAVTPSEKEVLKKAKADGLFTPLAGKTPSQKEKILKGLAEAGLPLPEGKTPSEKALVKKVRAAAGLAPEPTPSEKAGKIRKKAKKVGEGSRKGMGLSKSKAGIAEELEEIVKTTKCDRACGCDKKKIRFKHSYVKIRVTSPDISSLCPCPEECIPGVKAGVFTDNEGIKVTIGSVVCVPSYSGDLVHASREVNGNSTLINDDMKIVSLNGKDYFNNFLIEETNISSITNKDPSKDIVNSNEIQYILKSQFQCHSVESVDCRAKTLNAIASTHQLGSSFNENKLPVCIIKSASSLLSSSIRSKAFRSISLTSREFSMSGSSFSLLLVVKTESSLQLSTSGSYSSVCESFTTSSFESDDSLDSFGYLHYIAPNKCRKTKIEDLERLLHGVDYEAVDTLTSDTTPEIKPTFKGREKELVYGKQLPEYLIYRMSQTKLNHKVGIQNKTEPIVVVNNLNGYQDIMTAIEDILSRRQISDASIFVVVSSSDDDVATESVPENLDATIGIQISEDASNWRRGTTATKKNIPASEACGFNIPNDNRNYKVAPTFIQRLNSHRHQPGTSDKKPRKHKRCQVYVSKEAIDRGNSHIVGTDTTQDRPCSCVLVKTKHPAQNYDAKDNCVANVLSEVLIPVMATQAVAQGLSGEELPQAGGGYLAQPPVPAQSHQSFETLVKMCSMPPCSGHSDCHQPTRPVPPAPPPSRAARHAKPLPDSKCRHPCNCLESKGTKTQNRRHSRHRSNKRTHTPDICGHADPNKDGAYQPSNQRPVAAPKMNVETNTEACQDAMCPYHIELRKMRSEATQTTSGFKLNVNKKCSPAGPVKSALRKCELAATQVDLCGHRPRADASCGYSFFPPAPLPTLALTSEDQFNGFKLTINGKQCGASCPNNKQC